MTQTFMLADAGVEGAYGRADIRRRTVGATIFVDDTRSKNTWKRIFEAEKSRNFEFIHQNYFRINMREIFRYQVTKVDFHLNRCMTKVRQIKIYRLPTNSCNRVGTIEFVVEKTFDHGLN